MKKPTWLLRATVMSLHEQLLAAFGGSSGVRDPGLLESALTRAENKFAYESATAFDLAAAYAFGLVKNHPFVDGNKRIGFAAAVVFLERNGYRFEAAEADAVLHTLALAAGAETESEFSTWLEVHARRATPKVKTKKA